MQPSQNSQKPTLENISKTCGDFSVLQFRQTDRHEAAL